MGLSDFIGSNSSVADGVLTPELLREAFRQAKDERWICRECAFETYWYPWSMGEVLRCPDCGSVDWHHTRKPVPSV